MIEVSDTDLPNLRIISSYLHGYANCTSTMQRAWIDETTWQIEQVQKNDAK